MLSALLALAAASAALVPPGGGPVAPSRLDAPLRSIALSHARGVPHPYYRGEGPVPLYLELSRPEALPSVQAALEALGGSVAPITPTILSARLPPEALGALDGLPQLRRAELAPPRHPLLDLSVPEIGADSVRAGGDGTYQLATPLTGQGVAFGLLDTGIDYLHPAYEDAGVTTRVQALWDQTAATGTPPVGYSGGHLCDAADLQAGTCDTDDLLGHGSHVTATAAGSDSFYPGVAPDAYIYAVRSHTFEQVAESVKWIFEAAEAELRPAVVNLSIGGHQGAHDGQSLEERALDALLELPGRALVISAGNDGGHPIHLGYEVPPEGGSTELVLGGSSLLSGGATIIDLWTDPSADIDLRVRVTAADGTLLAQSAWLEPSFVNIEPLVDGDRLLGEFEAHYTIDERANGKDEAFLILRPSVEAPDATWGNAEGIRWFLDTRGTGRFDAWMPSTGAGSVFHPTRGPFPGDDQKTVATPGTTAKAITVASYATRDSWNILGGGVFVDDQVGVGEISSFTAFGPTGDPEFTGYKPDLAAPGEWIAAPYGFDAVIFNKDHLLEEDVVAMRGTSMAAPHVAGVVALMLEGDPQLDAATIKQLLLDTARAVPETLPHPQWGHGKVDAFAAVLAVVGAPIPPEPAQSCFGCGAAGGEGPWALLGLLMVVGPWRRRRPA